MIRTISSAVLLAGFGQALGLAEVEQGNPGNPKNAPPSGMSFFWDESGNPLNADGSKMDIAHQRVAW